MEHGGDGGHIESRWSIVAVHNFDIERAKNNPENTSGANRVQIATRCNDCVILERLVRV